MEPTKRIVFHLTASFASKASVLNEELAEQLRLLTILVNDSTIWNEVYLLSKMRISASTF